MHETLRKPAVDEGYRFLSHSEVLRIILGVMVSIFLAALDQTVVIPALPTIATDLNGYQQLSWIVAAYLITSTIAAPIYGKLSDVYGRRRMLIACITIFIATSMLCGAAGSFDQLVWFRAIQGLGGGGLTALNQSVIADVVSPRDRGRYQGYLSAVWAITSLCGPLVGGFIVQTLSWRWIFWINLPIGLAAIWACRKALRRLLPPTHPGKPKFDILGVLLLSGAITVWLLALGWGDTVYPWLSYEILGLIGLGGCLLMMLVAQERRAHDPLLPPSVFKSSSYRANVAISTLTALLMFICLFSIPLYFQLVRGSTAAQSGMYLIPFMLLNATGGVTASLWARHFGTLRGALHIATILSGVGLGLLALLPLDAAAWEVICATAVTGFGVGICLVGSIMGAQNALTARDIGSGTGALLVLRSIGGASGASLAGAIITSKMVALQHVTGGTVFSSTRSLHSHCAALRHAAQSGSCAASVHLTRTFAMVYAVAAIVAGISFVVTVLMPVTPLRKSPHLSRMSH